MRLCRGLIPLILMISAVVTIPAAVSNEESFIDHKVKKGESISLICLDVYGYYSTALGEAIKKDNPKIQDIDLIFEGQTILFRNPNVNKHQNNSLTKTANDSSSSKPQNSCSSIPDSIFTKKNIIQGVVTCVEGRVEYLRQGSNRMQSLRVNTLVFPGDTIVTGDNGRVELIINKESVVRLHGKTRLALEAFRDSTAGKPKTSLKFSVGTIWTKVKKFKDRMSRFELELPVAIAGVHGTVYETTVNPDMSSEVKVFSGEVAVSNNNKEIREHEGVAEVSGPREVEGPREVDIESWTKIVRSMQKISIGKNGKPSEPQSFSQQQGNEWEKWNEQRDKRIAEIFQEQ